MLTVLREAWFNRYYELAVASQHKAGKVRNPIYLSVGTELIPPLLKYTLQRELDWDVGEYLICGQHRCHSWYLTFGGDPVSLGLELCGESSGCNRGYGGSASISSEILVGHSGLLGDQVPIGVGLADFGDKPVVIVMGDAAAEEDYVLGAMGYAATRKVPCIFLVEDNNLSILTCKKERRSWELCNVARGFGINAARASLDFPNTIISHLSSLLSVELPVLLEISCTRHLWHAGSGQDEVDTSRDGLEYLTQQMGYDWIKHEEEHRVEDIWHEIISKT